MKATIKLSGIIVMLAMLGLAVTACDNGTTAPAYQMEYYEISAATYSTIKSSVFESAEAALKLAKDQTTTSLLYEEDGNTTSDVKSFLANFINDAADINAYAADLELHGYLVLIGEVYNSEWCGLVYIKKNGVSKQAITPWSVVPYGFFRNH